MRKFCFELWPIAAFVVSLSAIGDALENPVWLTKLMEDYGLLVLLVFWVAVAHFRRA